MFRDVPLPDFPSVLTKLESNSDIELADFLVLFDHYRRLFAEGKTDSSFLVSVGNRDEKLVEKLLHFARRPESNNLKRRAFIHQVVHAQRRLGTIPAPGARQLAES